MSLAVKGILICMGLSLAGIAAFAYWALFMLDKGPKKVTEPLEGTDLDKALARLERRRPQ